MESYKEENMDLFGLFYRNELNEFPLIFENIINDKLPENLNGIDNTQTNHDKTNQNSLFSSDDKISFIETKNTSKKTKNEKEKIQLTFFIINNNNINNKLPNDYYGLTTIIKILRDNNFPKTIIDKINPNFVLSKKNEKNRISLFKTKSLIGKKRINDTNNEANMENSAYANHTRYTQDNIIKKIKAIFFKNSIDYINNYLNRYKQVYKNIEANMENNASSTHTRYTQDNIIKKIKAIFFKNSIDYINNYLNRYKQVYKNIIYLRHLNHAYVDKLKKDYDLLLLSMPLKYFASLDISSNYSSISDKQFNRKLIIDILEKEKENTKIINFLDMTFNDLIDILLYKNIFNKFISLDGIKDDLEAIAKKTDDKDYFSKFILISYNYKRWFINKKGRSIKNDNNSQDNQ